MSLCHSVQQAQETQLQQRAGELKSPIPAPPLRAPGVAVEDAGNGENVAGCDTAILHESPEKTDAR
jgi:hypothetical protein